MNTPHNTLHNINDDIVVMSPRRNSDKLSNLGFWLSESKVIICAGISALSISISGTVIILYNNCAINNAAFSIISAVVGGWLGSLLSKK